MSKKSFLLLLLATLVYVYSYAHRHVTETKNASAVKIQKEIQKLYSDFVTTAQQGDELELSHIAGIDWDAICEPYTYSSASKRARYAFPNIDISNYSIADERYDDNEYGLIFIDHNKKLIVALKSDRYIKSNTQQLNPCTPDNAKISYQTEPYNTYLNYSSGIKKSPAVMRGFASMA